MNLRTVAVGAFALLFVVGMLSYHTASAGTGISVVQGSPVTLHWQFTGGVPNCKGVTTYPGPADGVTDGIKAAWETTHFADANGNGSAQLSQSVQASAGSSYTFTCTHYDVNHVADAVDSAVLSTTAPTCTNGANNPTACNACTAPLVWNGTGCVAVSAASWGFGVRYRLELHYSFVASS